jgi:hypothetical protein
MWLSRSAMTRPGKESLAFALPYVVDMKMRTARADEHLDLVCGADREHEVTNRRTTLVTEASRALVASVVISVMAACGGGGGGGKKTDTYARASDVQGQCCEHLKGANRDQCLQGIVRIDDQGVAASSANQQTYACVVDHFQCNPETGHPTQQSAQAQLECIQDLQQ